MKNDNHFDYVTRSSSYRIGPMQNTTVYSGGMVVIIKSIKGES